MPISYSARVLSVSLVALTVIAPASLAQGDEPLQSPVQITFPDTFLRAGEAYFNPDATWIIFQAIPRPAADTAPSSVYSMYVARIRRNPEGTVSGIEEPIVISPDGSANTCGFFHPLEPFRVIFGSTLTNPSAEAPAGYQRGTSTYAWQFPTEMEVVTRVVPQIYYEKHPKLTTEIDWPEKESEPTPMWTRDGYDAECAYSPNARHIVYTRVDPETLDPDLYVYDTRSKTHRPLVVHKGYDGGPFFSPDGSLICYRSDRKGNDLLQIYIAELTFSDDGQVLGVKREMQVTDNEHVNWAPFWHPSGEYLLYTTSEQGHRNYEIYSTEVPIGIRQGVLPADLKKRRITSTAGFDGLPVFSASGDLMMWTSQRGPKRDDEERPSSQLWVARPGDLAP